MALLTEEYLLSFVPDRFRSDERYRNGHIRILAPTEGTRILGMHTPEMKRVAKELVRGGDWREQLASWTVRDPLTGPAGLSHEERMIWGLVIDYAKVPLQQRLQLLDGFLPAIDNWALCDNFCCNAKWVGKEDKEQVWAYISGLTASEEEFRVRVGLILALAHFLDPKDLPRTLDTVAGHGYPDSAPYYVRMGVAWLFAEGLCKGYDATLGYLREHRLSPWIHNKAIQKARESWRITDERKRYLQTLKVR
ncbi:MAG: DNA alkylation repair protein [Bacteroidales bacterium]|nr:DNA alkylation repair protein [Bacteroidales bacterium]